jgi:hypothetical protein
MLLARLWAEVFLYTFQNIQMATPLFRGAPLPFMQISPLSIA